MPGYPPPTSKMVEGVGFEPTVGLTLRSISSRVPSTRLSHPSNFFFNHSSAANCSVAVVLDSSRINYTLVICAPRLLAFHQHKSN